MKCFWHTSVLVDLLNFDYITNLNFLVELTIATKIKVRLRSLSEHGSLKVIKLKNSPILRAKQQSNLIGCAFRSGPYRYCKNVSSLFTDLPPLFRKVRKLLTFFKVSKRLQSCFLFVCFCFYF